jgi:hypothetical protein
MDQTQQPNQAQQPRGDFVAYLNAHRERRMRANDPAAADLPVFHNGEISIPGTDQRFNFSLKGGTENNEAKRATFTGYTNNVPDQRTPHEQLSAMYGRGAPDERADQISYGNLSFVPGQISLFTNRATEEIYNELLRSVKSGDELRAAIRDRNLPPQYYGFWHPGVKDAATSTTALVHVSIWPALTKTGNKLMLTGRTQYPLPGKGAAAAPRPADDPEIPFDGPEDAQEEEMQR